MGSTKTKSSSASVRRLLPIYYSAYDLITDIIAGGVADCVVADRLAGADPKLSILLIEGGKINIGKEKITHPVFPR